MVDGHVRIDDAIITDRHPVADVGMWVNLTVFPDFNLLADVDERAYVTILFDGGRRRDTCRRGRFLPFGVCACSTMCKRVANDAYAFATLMSVALIGLVGTKSLLTRTMLASVS